LQHLFMSLFGQGCQATVLNLQRMGNKMNNQFTQPKWWQVLLGAILLAIMFLGAVSSIPEERLPPKHINHEVR
jgi:hypothetical protein